MLDGILPGCRSQLRSVAAKKKPPPSDGALDKLMVRRNLFNGKRYNAK